jgi:hypothetical protein
VVKQFLEDDFVQAGDDIIYERLGKQLLVLTCEQQQRLKRLKKYSSHDPRCKTEKCDDV